MSSDVDLRKWKIQLIKKSEHLTDDRYRNCAKILSKLFNHNEDEFNRMFKNHVFRFHSTYSDIDIYNVSINQRPVIRYSMARYIIYGCAN